MYAVFELQQFYTVKPVYCDHPREPVKYGNKRQMVS